MIALLLSAGYGTRISKFTNKKPKCLLEINNKPILQIWIEQLIKNNISKIIINTHYLSEQVTDFLNQNSFDAEIIISKEEKLLGTAGTLINNYNNYEKNDVLLIHADNYFPSGLDDFLIAHKKNTLKTAFSMLAFYSNYPTECGILEVDSKSILIKIHEKVNNPPSNLANGAIYLIKYDTVLEIANKFKLAIDFVNDIIPKFYGKIFVFKTENYLIDIGSEKNYLDANNFAKKQVDIG